MSYDLFYQVINAKALGSRQLPEVWSVSQVNALARRLLEETVPPLRVAGEISGFRRYPAGHCYFTLKDQRSRLACVMWRDDARRLPAVPPEGLAVRVLGRPSVYVQAGRLQFIVRELESEGEGLWRLAFERIRKKLEDEGLLHPSRKRRLPRFPACVGLVTSLEGAVLKDIVSVIRRRAPWTHIAVYPTRVQGDGATASITQSIRVASRTARADVLIVGRGGGSKEDLDAFNAESVARAIADSSMPVISAVGHETDITIADLVADKRAATPSAAAELAVTDGSHLQSTLSASAVRLRAALRERVHRRRSALDRLESQLVGALERLVSRRRVRMDTLSQRLAALGPISILERGYAVALGREGEILRSVGDFDCPMPFTLRLKDGRIRARAEGSEEEDRGE